MAFQCLIHANQQVLGTIKIHLVFHFRRYQNENLFHQKDNILRITSDGA